VQEINFYFDFLSPYSYLAWNWVRENFQKYHFNLIPCPLGSLIRHYETKGPAEIPPKRNYLFKNCLRYASLNGIKFNPPKNLPFNSLYALRMSLKENCGSSQFTVVNGLFTLGWEKGEDLGNEIIIVEELNRLGVDGPKLLERVGTREIREALKNNVSMALSKGVFGVPTFIIGEELFWGNDSIGHLELFLNGGDPLPRDKFEDFEKRNFTVF
jgi:2-hydroxychromene-2-carboxylate isomerase